MTSPICGPTYAVAFTVASRNNLGQVSSQDSDSRKLCVSDAVDPGRSFRTFADKFECKFAFFSLAPEISSFAPTARFGENPVADLRQWFANSSCVTTHIAWDPELSKTGFRIRRTLTAREKNSVGGRAVLPRKCGLRFVWRERDRTISSAAGR
jgi:hypothetical protein